MDEQKISIVSVSESDLRSDDLRTVATGEIEVQKLADSLKTFLGRLDQVMKDLNAKVGGFEVDEMEIYAEVSGEGKISLLGTGVQTGAMGGLKLILRRPSSKN